MENKALCSLFFLPTPKKNHPGLTLIYRINIEKYAMRGLYYLIR